MLSLISLKSHVYSSGYTVNVLLPWNR